MTASPRSHLQVVLAACKGSSPALVLFFLMPQVYDRVLASGTRRRWRFLSLPGTLDCLDWDCPVVEQPLESIK